MVPVKITPERPLPRGKSFNNKGKNHRNNSRNRRDNNYRGRDDRRRNKKDGNFSKGKGSYNKDGQYKTKRRSNDKKHDFVIHNKKEQ